MPDAPPNSALKRRVNVVLSVLFVVLLGLPTLDSFCHIDYTEPHSENRRLAVFPNVPTDWHGLRAYVSGLEAYFNDHFGFRKCLLQWHLKFKTAVFREKTTSNVLIGKDGWLFYTLGDAVDHYTGLIQFTPQQLRDWQALLEKRRDWCAKRGIAYLFVATPTKLSIYPEELPNWVVKVSPQTKLDQLVGYLRQHSTVPVLDVRDVVRHAKQFRPTYLKTDSHWNNYGGFVAYQELMRTLAAQLPGLKPLPLDDFTVTNLPWQGGDLARLLGVSMPESNCLAFVPNPDLPRFTTQLPSFEHPKDPKFSTNSQAKGCALVFHDSYAMAWIQFLGYNFNRVTYLWRYDLDPAWIERDHPDVVINEMNELYVNIEDPAKLLLRDSLNGKPR